PQGGARAVDAHPGEALRRGAARAARRQRHRRRAGGRGRPDALLPAALALRAQVTAMGDEGVFDYARWEGRLDALAPAYRAAQPFPHVMLDDFLLAPFADRMREEFPAVTDREWIHYRHVNESKHGQSDPAALGPALGAAIGELLSPRFVAFLTRLTG